MCSKVMPMGEIAEGVGFGCEGFAVLVAVGMLLKNVTKRSPHHLVPLSLWTSRSNPTDSYSRC